MFAYQMFDLPLKIIYTFNKLYGSFLRDIKDVDDDVKKKVKANYKVIVKNSPEYQAFFWNSLLPFEAEIDASNAKLLDVQVFKDITIGDIVSKVDERNATLVWNYIYILSALSMVYEKSDEEVEKVVSDDEEDVVDSVLSEKQVIFDKIVKVFGLAQRGEDTSSELSDIVDDDLRNVLGKLTKVDDVTTAPVDSDAGAEDILNMFSSLEDSKICNLAKEISKEIDVSDLKLESPQDVMKLMDFSSGNNVLGNIIGKVSNKIQEKMSTGELKHEDLLGEAMTMMGMMQKSGAGGGLFNNPMMTEMMKNVKKGKAVPRTDVIKKDSTRERLRKKLEERKTSQ